MKGNDGLPPKHLKSNSGLPNLLPIVFASFENYSIPFKEVSSLLGGDNENEIATALYYSETCHRVSHPLNGK